MSSLFTRRLLGVAAVLAAWTVAVSALAQSNMGEIEGRCKGEDGKPLAGWTILLERKSMNWKSHAKTGKKGDYTFIGLAPDDYTVTLVNPSGQTIDHAQEHVGMGATTEADFDLAKERADAAKQNPQAAQHAEEQANSQKQFTGLKAIFDQGQSLYVQKHYAEAAAMFEKAMAVAKDKNVTIVEARLADAYAHAATADKSPDARKADEQKAIDAYQKALQLSPGDATLHAGLGGVYAEMGKVPDAQAECQKAADANPGSASICFYNLGVIMVNQGKMDDAATALKKATEVNPNNANAFYWEGMALMGKAETKPDGSVVPVPGTVEAFQAYLKLEPTGQWAQAAQASLDQIQNKVPTEYKKTKKK